VYDKLSGADLGFYKGGCPIHLKRAPEVERRRVGSENFCVSYIKMVSFMHADKHLVKLKTTFFEHRFFEKGHPNQKRWCPDTLDTPGSATEYRKRLCTLVQF